MEKYKVLKARLVYDEFEVLAGSPREAADLVARGKIRESLIGIAVAPHDDFYDDKETIVVLSAIGNSTGLSGKLFDSNIHSLEEKK